MRVAPKIEGARLSCPCRRGTFIVPVEVEWIIQPGAVDPTSGSLQTANSEGDVYRARGSGMDNPTLRSGSNKQVPPRNGRDTRVP